jgi:hypothetical protein
MATFIKAGFWEKLCIPCKGYKGWLNLDQFVESKIPAPTPPAYQIYTALISQSGTNAPTVTVLENTIGNIVWTYDSTGEYLGTLTGVFISNKTYFSALPSQITQLKFVRINNNIVNLGTALAGVKTNGLLNNTSIEIRIYP